MRKIYFIILFTGVFSLVSGLINQAVGQTNAVADNTELAVLKKLYDSLGGSGWTIKTNWPTPGNWPASATSSQFGTWSGITVTDGDITLINLSQNNLTGFIPDISPLAKLQTIYFQYNFNIGGKIPATLGSMPSLQNFNIMYNKITGSIPSQIGNSTSLVAIALNYNLLTGAIPASLGNITTLTGIGFSGNGFTGNIPDLSGLVNLQQISFDDCTSLTAGPIPSWLYNCSHLNYISMLNSHRNGSISANLGNLTNLTYLALNSNQLTGPIPFSIGNLTALTGLDLRANQLTGSIPSSIGNLTQLSVFYVDNNQLSGIIPSSIGSCTNLLALGFSTNALTGIVPPQVGSLIKLSSLLLNNNQFSGSLPSTLGNLTHLGLLYVFNNQFTGSLPPEIGSLPLSYFLANNNKFTGEIPSSYSGMTGMYYFDVSYNGLTGVLPSGVGNWHSLGYLNLSNNSLSGDFPTTIGSDTQLTYLNAGFNKFKSLPTGLLSLPVITYINFTDNEITAIPAFSGQANKTHLTLNVNNNRLDFSTLETLPSAGIYSINSLVQKTINDVLTKSIVVGTDLILTTRPPGLHSTVSWEKQQSNGTWSSVNSLDADATLATFKRSPAALTDKGNYRWKMTNTAVAGITIQSDAIDVDDFRQIAMDNFGYQYRYDNRRRMSQKKMPGADWVYMVYDTRDRLVLTQDGEQRKLNQWLFTKYDLLNRPVMTGLMDTTLNAGIPRTQADMQAAVDGYYAKSSARFGEAFVGTATGNIHGYSNKSYPVRAESSTGKDANMYLTVSYYDDYGFRSLVTDARYNYQISDITTSSTVNGITYTQESAAFPVTTGLNTGGAIRILGTATFLSTVNYYDQKNRVIQTTTTNHLGGVDRNTQVVDFIGKPLISKTTYITDSLSTQIIQRTFEYDHSHRMVKTWHQLNSGTPVLLTFNKYNELGQVIDKSLHSTDAASVADNTRTFKQSVDYRYDIRGWLTSINNSTLVSAAATNDDTNDLFGMNLIYEQPVSGLGNVPQYNGNISAVKWSNNLAKGFVPDFAYSYTYDTLNRIKSATFLKDSVTWNNQSNAFNENNYAYDLNGNILKLNRTGKSGLIMDVLSYDYGPAASRSNKLLSVTDNGGTTAGFTDGNTSGNDYSYDTNGSMSLDKNKSITSITYNYLHLPERVIKNTGEYIQYVYDATGKKLRQKVFSPTAHKKTDYNGELYAENDTLKFIIHEEGRVVTKGGTAEYQYFLKDHLGNVRVTFTSVQTPVTNTAGFESANTTTESTVFQNYPTGANLVMNAGFAHAGVYSERLTGGANSQVGVTKSFSVVPGDIVSISAYGKYAAPTSTAGNITGFATALLNAFGLTTPAAGETGTPSSAINAYGAGEAAGHKNGSSDTADPLAFVTILMFDRNYNFLDASYSQLTSVAQMIATYTAKQPGYAYLYISNEQTYQTDVYFDDVVVKFTPSPVVQLEDYYPFGLTFNSYNRENTLKNKFLYNAGSEFQDDLGIDVSETDFRVLDSQIASWWQMDPKSEKLVDFSPYNYGFNNPILHNDPKGDCPPGENCPGEDNGPKTVGEKLNAAVDYFKGGASLADKIQTGLQMLLPKAAIGVLFQIAEGKEGEITQQQGAAAIKDVVSTALLFLGPETKVAEAGTNGIGGATKIAEASTAVKTVAESSSFTKSLVNQAGDLVKANGGKNSVTIGTPTMQIRFDLAGKAHGNVSTPHMQVYNKNFLNGQVRSISRTSKKAVPMTQQDIRVVRKYLGKKR